MEEQPIEEQPAEEQPAEEQPAEEQSGAYENLPAPAIMGMPLPPRHPEEQPAEPEEPSEMRYVTPHAVCFPPFSLISSNQVPSRKSSMPRSTTRLTRSTLKTLMRRKEEKWTSLYVALPRRLVLGQSKQ